MSQLKGEGGTREMITLKSVLIGSDKLRKVNCSQSRRQYTLRIYWLQKPKECMNSRTTEEVQAYLNFFNGSDFFFPLKLGFLPLPFLPFLAPSFLKGTNLGFAPETGLISSPCCTGAIFGNKYFGMCFR